MRRKCHWVCGVPQRPSPLLRIDIVMYADSGMREQSSTVWHFQRFRWRPEQAITYTFFTLGFIFKHDIMEIRIRTKGRLVGAMISPGNWFGELWLEGNLVLSAVIRKGFSFFDFSPTALLHRDHKCLFLILLSTFFYSPKKTLSSNFRRGWGA